MHLTFSRCLFVALLALSSCTAPLDDANDVEAIASPLITRPEAAECDAPLGTSFVLRRNPGPVGVQYTLSDLVVRGEAKPGTFATSRSPLGARLRTSFWNGTPLDGNRFVTETRFEADPIRRPLSDVQGFHERVRCTAVLRAPSSFVDRFRLAYEYKVTGIYPERHDPAKLRQLGKVPASALPGSLTWIARDHSSWPVYAIEFEGKRLYEWRHVVFTTSPVTSLYHDFYDESGAPLAAGAMAAQVFPKSTLMTPKEWETLPRIIWSWHE